MSERNKKTPWDEELEAQVLAEEQAKRKQANAEQLANYDVLSSEQKPNPNAALTGGDPVAMAELLGEAELPTPEAKQPTLGVDVDSHTFATEDAAVKHFERAYAPSGGSDNFWTRLEDHFGAKELRIYIGTVVLILIVLMFSQWFNMSASGIKAAKQGLDKHNATVQEGVDTAAEGESAD